MNTLYALGEFSKNVTVLFLVIIVIVAVISLACYLPYYNLDGVRGYIDGMIPLLLVALMMIAMTVGVAVS